MGLFWDLVQQSQISEQRTRASSIEDRLAHIEAELARTQEIVHVLVTRLESSLGEDLDCDGRIG